MVYNIVRVGLPALVKNVDVAIKRAMNSTPHHPVATEEKSFWCTRFF